MTNKDDVFCITRDGEVLLTGDKQSLGVTYRNLIGDNFIDNDEQLNHQEYSDYLELMEQDHGPLIGKTIELIDDIGNCLQTDIICL